MIQVVSAKARMNGSRTASGASVANRCAPAHCIHHDAGGWSKYPSRNVRPVATM